MLEIHKIRRDGGTQHRILPNPEVIAEYSELMTAGVVFPPIAACFDGHEYWVSDGFQRIAACERIGRLQISAEIRRGTQSDAQWDSFRANSDHGLRRTISETVAVIKQALCHPQSATMSNIEIAQHLNIPEATLRRWRNRISPSVDEDKVRVVTRGQSTYSLKTSNIGRKRPGMRPKSRRVLREELSQMKAFASPDVRCVLNIVGNWALGSATSSEAVLALETVVGQAHGHGHPQT